jgi:hypothetical protein
MARGWVVLLFLALFILTTSVVFPFFANLLDVPEQGVEPIDTQFTYSPARLYEIMAAYGEDGRRGYALSHLTADVIFPLVYSFFFGTAISFTFRGAFLADSRLQMLNLTPFALLVVDLLENTLLVILLLAFPAPLTILAAAAGAVTAVKWLFSGAVVLLVVVGLALWAYRLINRKE